MILSIPGGKVIYVNVNMFIVFITIHISCSMVIRGNIMIDNEIHKVTASKLMLIFSLIQTNNNSNILQDKTKFDTF